jgi:hypothetical protein
MGSEIKGVKGSKKGSTPQMKIFSNFKPYMCAVFVGSILTPLYLGNYKSYSKSVGIAHTGIKWTKFRIKKL